MTSAGRDAGSRHVLRRYWFDIPLWKRIIPAFALGVLAGVLLGERAVAVQWMGDVFVRLARMLVVPLIFFTITAGVGAMGDARRLGSLGIRALALFVSTAAAAATIGVVLGLILEPGVGVSMTGARAQTIAPSQSLADQLIGIIPLNPVAALAEGQMFPVIFFGFFFAIGAVTLGARAQPLIDVLNLASEVMMRLVGFVMETAPFGVFGLIAATVGTHGLGSFLNVWLLALGTFTGCVLTLFIVHFGAIGLLARLSPLRYLSGAFDALVIGFSSSSSSAALPAALSIAQEKFGLHKSVVSTVLPVGTGIARDGTAMFVALLSIFASQALGLSLSLGHLSLVVACSTLLALSAPPIPSAAMFMMAAVLSVLGIDDAHSALIVGFVLPFDRLFDMMRTSINVSANLVNATVMARRLGELDVEIFMGGSRPETETRCD